MQFNRGHSDRPAVASSLSPQGSQMKAYNSVWADFHWELWWRSSHSLRCVSSSKGFVTCCAEFFNGDSTEGPKSWTWPCGAFWQPDIYIPGKRYMAKGNKSFLFIVSKNPSAGILMVVVLSHMSVHNLSGVQLDQDITLQNFHTTQTIQSLCPVHGGGVILEEDIMIENFLHRIKGVSENFVLIYSLPSKHTHMLHS